VVSNEKNNGVYTGVWSVGAHSEAATAPEPSHPLTTEEGNSPHEVSLIIGSINHCKINVLFLLI
jgi:hypothetical protein